MVELFKAYGRIKIDSLCEKLKTMCLPVQFIILVEHIGKKTYVSTSDEGCLSDEWNGGNGVRQGGVTSGILLNST